MIKYTITKFKKNYENESKKFVVTFLALQISRFIPYVLIAKFIGVIEAGIWSLMLVVINIGKLSSFGVPNSINRIAPIYAGQKKYKILSELEYGGVSWTIFTSIAYGIGCYYFFKNYHNNPNALLYGYLPIAVIFVNIQQIMEMIQKGRQNFKLVSESQVGQSLILLLGSLIFIYEKSYHVAVSLYIASYGYSIYSLRLPLKIINPLRWMINNKNTMNQSFGLFLSTLLSLVNMSIDKLYISEYLGIEELGIYSITLFVTGGLMMVPSAIAQLNYSKTGFAYGQNASIVDVLKKSLEKANSVLKITSILSIVVLGAVEILINTELTEYKKASTSMLILVLSVLLYSYQISFGNALLVLSRIKILIIASLTGVVVNIAILALVTISGVVIKIEYVALSFFTSLVVQSSLIIISAYILYRNSALSA